MLKIDLHVHTRYSYDAVTTLKDVITHSKRRGLDGIAVTDHDNLTGALKLLKTKDLIIIPGVEVSTKQGHILALNVTTPIPPKLDAQETIQKIHEAHGIAIASHPATIFKDSLGTNEISTLNFDALEVINSAAFPFSLSTYLNRRLAKRLNLPQTGGSDAHFPWEIGLAYTVVDAEPEVDAIIQAIKDGRVAPFGEALSLKMRFRRVIPS